MNTIIYSAACFSARGRKENNEDFLLSGSLHNRSFFILCDGVGGAAKGEVASRLACESFARFFERNENNSVDEAYVRSAIETIETEFDRTLASSPDTEGMATTLALLLFDGQNACAVHVGDSRIYHIRNGSVLFQTRDHLLVNDLVDSHVLTPEEAAKSPQRNVLTRAVRGYSVKPSKPDTAWLNDLQAGDYFFLCSDGVTESISDADIAFLCHPSVTEEEIIRRIQQTCEQYSYDNYSGYLVRIKDL